ncbi:MAG TPA: Imm50 family immunity protein [Gemmataceae bacterium]|nr:Imm50 family immunity protein [Gemmataceae bacterium]
MDVIERIGGAEKLVAVFGYWPSFHDAEVLWSHLDRQPHGEGYGPTLEALVHVFEITSEVGPDGCYVLRHHVLVHFRFLDVVELRLEGFNHQNALFGLGIADLRERQWEYIQFEVRFDSANGVDALFRCHAIEVVSVTPCSKAGKPISA